MNIKTITFDADQWQLVPKEMDFGMDLAASKEINKCAELNYGGYPDAADLFAVIIAAAPQPPEVDSMATASVSPWLPIESAPKDGSNFYVTGFNYGNASNGRWHDVGHVTPRGGIKSTLTWLNLDFATHWMPLPVFDGGQ